MKSLIVAILNKILRRTGLLLVPVPYSSGKMLREVANVVDTHHPVTKALTNRWLRDVADIAEG